MDKNKMTKSFTDIKKWSGISSSIILYSNDDEFFTSNENEKLSIINQKIKNILRLWIKKVYNFTLKTNKKRKEVFSKYKQLYKIAMEQNEKLLNKLKLPPKINEHLKIKKRVCNQSYIPKKKNIKLIQN